jgi:hypothetical protein
MSDLHLDDEALRAHLDGDALESPRLRHLEGCAVCSARLAAHVRVRAAVGAPVASPAPWQVDRAITAALDAAADARDHRPARLFRAGGIAAALLLVLGAAFGLTRLTGSDRSERATTGAATRESATAGTGSPAPVALGDLGEIAGDEALRAVVEPSVAQFSAGAARVPAPSSAQDQSRYQDALEKRTDAGPAAAGAARTRTVCSGAARALDPANVRPVAEGTATWQGTPADVLVYGVEERPGSARVYVLARDGCRVLSFQSYAP